MFVIPNLTPILYRTWFQLGDTIATINRRLRWTCTEAVRDTTSDKVFEALNTFDYFTVLQPLVSTPTKILGESLTLDPNPDRVAVEYSTSVSGFGTGGSVALPGQVAGLVSFGSATMGKRGEGRNYVPFPPSAANELNGSPTATYITNLQALGTMMTSTIPCPNIDSSGTGALNAILRSTPGSPTTGAPITRFSVPTVWATQRRRGGFGKFARSPF